MTKVGLYAIGKSTTLESNKSLDRIVAWLEERPRAKTQTSRFAALAPACAIPAGTPPEKTPADLPSPMTSSKSKL
jgi:hypothetical protein